MLKALRTFILGSKGNATSTLMKDVGIQYKTAFLLQQKFRNGLKHCIDEITLEGAARPGQGGHVSVDPKPGLHGAFRLH